MGGTLQGFNPVAVRVAQKASRRLGQSLFDPLQVVVGYGEDGANQVLRHRLRHKLRRPRNSEAFQVSLRRIFQGEGVVHRPRQGWGDPAGKVLSLEGPPEPACQPRVLAAR